MKITLSNHGHLALPPQLCRQDGLEPGDEFEFKRIGPGEYRLVHLERPKNHGLVAWLLACPEKGFFVPIESEPTDRLRGTPSTTSGSDLRDL